MLDELLERFEQTFPLSAMGRALLEVSISPKWVEEVFETHRGRQYPKQLMFSTVISLMTMVTVGLRGSVHAAAKQARLGASAQALYDKIKRTEPALMRALVQGSAQVRIHGVVDATTATSAGRHRSRWQADEAAIGLRYCDPDEPSTPAKESDSPSRHAGTERAASDAG